MGIGKKGPKRPPMPPGNDLRRDFLEPRRICQRKLAEHLAIPVPNFNDIVQGKARITPRIAWKLGGALGTGPEYWMDRQTACDLWKAKPAVPTPLFGQSAKPDRAHGMPPHETQGREQGA